ncbi:hypothetical protein [Flavivirga rizhaonensis]|uniref:Redoxin domain-containing protein n=1 Tax=Flavivirga rizhaonensis TaxID=2559571 RepID=A0A4S1DYR1_9FLAO|nr:hypothetical protein [Flavivirga rizhaonensis]TGV03451.1 hypothetical protein EM932_07195 [Flavivirga rizhaonensis]
MNNVKYIVFIVILLILNAVLIYKLNSYSKGISKIRPVLNQYREGLLNFEQNFVKESENENLILDQNTKFLDIEGNLIKAKDLFKSNSVVLRYSETNCEACINAEINTLLKNNSDLKNSIVLIASYRNSRDLYVYYKEYEKKGISNIKMFLLLDKSLNIPIEKLNKPYYFCIDSNLRMSNFFIPQENKPQLSESYLQIIPISFLN